MGNLSQEVTAALANIRLTAKGREYLARGFNDGNSFDIVKFSFGDSEVDYRLNETDNAEITGLMVNEPEVNASDFKSKLYITGSMPSGTPIVTLSSNELNMSKNSANQSVSVYTDWKPIDGQYIEEYRWTNLGPLNDWDFAIERSLDTKIGTFRTYDTAGSTRIKIEGLTSGRYSILTLNIE